MLVNSRLKRKKNNEEGKVRKFKKLLANLMTAAVRYGNEFKNEIQGFSRKRTAYNKHEGMTICLEGRFKD